MFGYCYHSYDCGCKGREKTSAKMVYQDANMDKCRFYTHPFMLIIRQIQISAHFRYMDTLKRYMRLQTGTFGGKTKK